MFDRKLTILPSDAPSGDSSSTTCWIWGRSVADDPGDTSYESWPFLLSSGLLDSKPVLTMSQGGDHHSTSTHTVSVLANQSDRAEVNACRNISGLKVVKGSKVVVGIGEVMKAAIEVTKTNVSTSSIDITYHSPGINRCRRGLKFWDKIELESSFVGLSRQVFERTRNSE